MLWAARDDLEVAGSGLLVMMRVTSADGLHHRKSGIGDALPPVPGRMMRVNWSGGVNEPRSFYGYVHPRIRRLTLTVRDGGSVDVPLYDCPDFPEVRFAALVIPGDLLIKSVTGYGRDGEPVARKVVPAPGHVTGYSGVQSDLP